MGLFGRFDMGCEKEELGIILGFLFWAMGGGNGNVFNWYGEGCGEIGLRGMMISLGLE